MPRSNRPRRRRGRAPERPGAGDLSRLAGIEVEFAGQTWAVRNVAGNASGREYRCPGCQQNLTAAQPHVVVWPVQGMRGMENRRHWHSGCWRARDQRRPGGSWA